MLVNNKPYHTIWLENSTIKIIDQRKLPFEFVIEELKTVEDVFTAIKDMHVRGAPLIGVTAAYGMYLACLEANEDSDIKKYAEKLKSARPTAIDLMWAIDTMLKFIEKSSDKIKTSLETANTICEKSLDQCSMIGTHGYKIIEEIYKKKKSPVNILTHCNAGWLATVDYGTATSPIYMAHEKGIPLHVWVDETRPRNQGYLTAWELGEQGINHTVIVDNTGGHLMQRGMVDLVIVGSDRTTLSGDVTNKIGTYLKALAAKDNNIPFYVALPSSSIEWAERDHRTIPIEERSSEEVDFITGLNEDNICQKIRIMPKNSRSANYAFDVTPARLVTGLITERGICNASKQDILRLFPENG
ncbi:MAG: S-methyl-5-thioribose-1-phosphate isomerase [archaeon]